MVLWTQLTQHPKLHLDHYRRFCTDHGRESYTLRWATIFPLKIAPSRGVSGPPSNTWFTGPTQVHTPNGISIGSVILQCWQLWRTDWQTDHTTLSVSVAIGCIYIVLWRSLLITLNSTLLLFSKADINIHACCIHKMPMFLSVKVAHEILHYYEIHHKLQLL